MTAYHHRYIARFDLATTSPLAVRSGAMNWVSDQLIYRDAFGLPAIRGTSIAGLLRSCCATDLQGNVFGFAEEDQGEGSRIIVSSACLIGSNNQCIQTLSEFMNQKETLLPVFTTTIERERVRIDHKGVAVDRGKFNEEILPLGARFRFELMLKGNEEDQDNWKKLLNLVHSDQFLLGSGTRNGRGQFEVLNCVTKTCNLTEQSGRDAWLAISSDLNQSDQFEYYTATAVDSPFKKYTLSLKAKDFFQMGAGYGETIATKDKKEVVNIDQVYKKERKITYEKSNTPSISEEEFLLLPGTSIKGALAHRFAYHYNVKAKRFANDRDVAAAIQQLEQEYLASLDDWKMAFAKVVKEQLAITHTDDKTVSFLNERLLELNMLQNTSIGEVKHEIIRKKTALDQKIAVLKKRLLTVDTENEAVNTLFGFAKEKVAQRGRVIVDDVSIAMNGVTEKLFNHVKIDRFTGGAFAGALFNELTSHVEDEIKVIIRVEKEGLEDTSILTAFEQALADIKTGQLPLGKGVMKGHGVFEAVNE